MHDQVSMAALLKRPLRLFHPLLDVADLEVDELAGDGDEGLRVALAYKFVPLGVQRLRGHLTQVRRDSTAAAQ